MNILETLVSSDSERRTRNGMITPLDMQGIYSCLSDRVTNRVNMSSNMSDADVTRTS